HGADLHRLLIVAECFLRKGERFLLHAHIFKRVNQVPVKVLDLVHGGDYLQAKGYIGNFAIIFSNPDEASVGQKSETLQKFLGHAKLKIRSDGGTERAERIISGYVAIIESYENIGSSVKSLLIAYVGGASISIGDGSST